MPAMLNDPTSPTIYRTSGQPPFPEPHDPQPALPIDVYPRQVTLRDRVTVATIVPFSSQHQVPSSLLAYLGDQFNKEIENGDTYPMMNGMPVEQFSSYWFQNFAAVMLLGNIESTDELVEEKNWATECLGSFYIKPNYPGRSSHVCNAGFLVTDAARNKGVGRLMGENYLEWAPRLGYIYSVFNLVYETNVASCRIWDALGFKRIGRVKGAGNLKSYPGQLIDAIIYGRDLGPEGEDFVSEERFDKIKFYLKYAKYPAGADRAEKSRLRSAATHYKLIPENDKLMLKDKEVISDPQRQYEIARSVHVQHHGGINKTTATIAEKYHWVRIKETVSLVIRNCSQCKELGKAPVVVRGENPIRAAHTTPINPLARTATTVQDVNAAGRALSLAQQHHPAADESGFPAAAGQGSVSPQVLNRTLPPSSPSQQSSHHAQIHPPSQLQAPIARISSNDYMPLDPQMMDPRMMEDVRHHLHYEHEHEHEEGHGYSQHEEDHEFQDMLTDHKNGNENESELSHHNDLDMLIEDGEGGPGETTSFVDGHRQTHFEQNSRSHEPFNSSFDDVAEDGEGDVDEEEDVIRLQAEAAEVVMGGAGGRSFGDG